MSPAGAGRVVAGLAAAVVGAAGFLPWLHSGATRRSVFEVAGLARDLGLLQGSTAHWCVIVLSGVPLLAALVVLGLASRWWRTVAIPAAVVGVLPAALAAWVHSQVPSRYLGAGPAVLVVAALVLATGSAVAAIAGRSSLSGVGI